MSDRFPLIEVKGSPRERGLQYGEAARDRIALSREMYRAAFRKNGLEWEQVRELSSRYIAAIREYDADLMEEIEGIAAGANQEVETIVALNARTELMYWKPKQDEDSEGCTGAIALPEATADGHLIHGQNWDWKKEAIETAVILKVKPDAGPAFITFTEAGLLARCGMNSAGIAVTGNFLQSDRDFGRSGIPIPFVRRKILASASLADAVGVVIRSPRTFSSNHMISDAAGFAINLEASPEEVFWLLPERGMLIHANHFKNPAAKAKLMDTVVSRFPDTLYRDYRVESVLVPKHGRIGVRDFQEAFRDHYGKPEAVCRHLPTGTVDMAIQTVASVIMDTTTGKMWVARGPVCENEYYEYTLES